MATLASENSLGNSAQRKRRGLRVELHGRGIAVALLSMLAFAGTVATRQPGPSSSITIASAGRLALTLGTFSLDPRGNDNYGGENFNLLVSFILPVGLAGSTSSAYTAALAGSTSSAHGQCKPNPNSCGNVKINFDNALIPFTFAIGNTTGSFSFSVHDLTILAGQTDVTLTGNITLAQQTTTTTVSPSAVP